jgi:hypothetical protein
MLNGHDLLTRTHEELTLNLLEKLVLHSGTSTPRLRYLCRMSFLFLASQEPQNVYSEVQTDNEPPATRIIRLVSGWSAAGTDT